jgi:uncharacterized surface protein with fasciclin (FAS1) repeats
MLPAGTVDTLLKPESKPALANILAYHVVPEKLDAATLMQRISAGNGKASLKTVNAESLVATMKDGKVMVMDSKGGIATVTIADVMQSNGVIHVVDKVLLPK